MSELILVTHTLRCLGCHAEITPEAAPANFRCERCGELFDVVYPEQAALPAATRATWLSRRLSRNSLDESGVWRFREALPILSDWRHAVTLREGNTPLYAMPHCAKFAGVDTLWGKHQGMNPTGSFKDTGMTAAISVAKERGAVWVACASTGNTSAAMAAYAARAGVRALVLIPEGKIAWGKLAQTLDYGALTLQLRTDFDGCVKVLAGLVKRAPVYLLNSVNPYRLEGQKTPAFEIAEQMDWQVPDHLIVPGGNLANSSALGLGFRQLLEWGLIDRLPKISIIQAEGANPLFASWQQNGGRELQSVVADTRATAIRIGNPASWKKAVRVLRETNGFCEQVSEAEIALAKAEIGAEGLGCEPASAVTLAGLRKLVRQGKVQTGEKIVLLLTGHLLKDPEYVLDFHRGNLLTAAETNSLGAEDKAAMQRLARAPQILDGSVDAVLQTLEAEARR
jgi:threonine synthase